MPKTNLYIDSVYPLPGCFRVTLLAIWVVIWTLFAAAQEGDFARKTADMSIESEIGPRPQSAASILKIFEPIEIGYRDFNYGTTVISTPTGEKPESKLWWNDGSWWGVLWDTVEDVFTIQRFNEMNQSWENTGVEVEARHNAKADALWDESAGKLYVVTNVFSNNNTRETSTSQQGRFYRFGYNSGSGDYSHEVGPVNVNEAKGEALVIDKDTTGKLWVAYAQDGRVMVNTSSDDGATWGTPFELPVQGSSDMTSDDICSVAAFGAPGDGKIGIMWSNQDDWHTYFAVHNDGASDNIWQDREIALGNGSDELSDDHINFTPACDGSGDLYAVTKTSLGGSDPYIYLLKREAGDPGTWSAYVHSTAQYNLTRPIVVLDEENQQLFVFTAIEGGSTKLYMKYTSMNNISFEPGLGSEFISSSSDDRINNPTSTKQCIDRTTGLLTLASDQDTKFYFHNFLSGNDPPLPVYLSLFSGNVEDGNAVLSWVTESQVNTLGFEVHCSTELHGAYQIISGYETNAQLAGLGNANYQYEYQYTDTTVNTGQTYWYKLVDVDINGKQTSHGPLSITIPSQAIAVADFSLHPNYPNPFNASTTIQFDIVSLPQAQSHARLSVYNSLGELVTVLFYERVTSGSYEVRWNGTFDNGREAASGSYFVVLAVENSIQTRQITLIK